MNINEMTVILTGATGGIGRAIAKQLCTQVQFLILVGRNRHRLDTLKEQLLLENQRPPSTILCVDADITTIEGRSELFRHLTESHCHANVLVNNAGINHFALFDRQSRQQVDDIMLTNTLAPMQLTRDYLDFVNEHPIPEAQIINVGSTFGSIGYPGYSAYSASKFALRGFTEALSRELMGTAVTLKYFAPRATKTALNATQAIAMNEHLNVTMDDPQLVATQFLQLLVSKQRRKHVGWPEKLLVKVNQMFPTLIDRAISQNLPAIRRFATQR